MLLFTAREFYIAVSFWLEMSLQSLWWQSVFSKRARDSNSGCTVIYCMRSSDQFFCTYNIDKI
jgi:hypothetical protein